MVGQRFLAKWTREQSIEYERLASEVKELQKEIDQRIEYQRYISNDQTSKDEKKFKRETKDIGILDLMKSLVARKSGNSKLVDTGKVNEFVVKPNLNMVNRHHLMAFQFHHKPSHTQIKNVCNTIREL